MSYTFQPLLPVDTLHYHGGVLIIGFLVTCAMFILSATDDYAIEWVSIIWIVIMAYPTYNSFTSGDIRYYNNTPVTGELVTVWAEQHQENRTSGKMHSVITVHDTYVSYRIPDGGVVSFPMAIGIAYPEKAILYKN